ncbi:MAG: Mth938-like domain-containing protein [Pseudomonadota bacterium]|jgi:uncharacterized protein|uniref:Mth938-like domain-containing protein n=1 Tax=Serpentinimonas maccroryi TaxID=1458426 RepID=UPI00054C4168|nr:Mth938-like domain-containing protein [Serpentinimonas maccroryi]KJS75594.1 MAG: hypothetical protein JM57_02660 [Comamonadaceae bacterium BICA1-1]MCM2478727.1 Xcc1710-like domain-containing protein [Serpentinimonas maccroryi]OYX59593.1 MAG: hypothetical protein B7Y96_04495 [Comamonadaceae bacterium 32-67-11]OZA90924.1 MAG: hypothetical protein B7X56_01485 [Burkholderiales bacterium 34-67-9]
MKLQPDRIESTTVRAHGPGWLQIGDTTYRHSLLLCADGRIQPWDCTRHADIALPHFALLAAWQPELLLLGSGARLRFVAPALLRPLIDAGIGVETMDTLAAARTYNILAGEGRRVAAALLIEPEARTS